MGRRRPLVTAEWVEKRLKKGYGCGEGFSYRPFIVNQNFSSRGRMHRIWGWLTGRVHHLFSDLERNVFFKYVRDLSVVDIREQYPLLPIEETVEIARAIGVKHPIDNRTKYPIPRTTDLLITREVNGFNSLFPRTVKYEDELKDERVKELLEIERRYWAATPRNLKYKIAREDLASWDFVINMLWVYPCQGIERLHPLKEQDINRISILLTWLVQNEDLPLWRIGQQCDRRLRLEEGTGLSVIRHLIATHYWEVDMDRLIDTDERLILKNQPSRIIYGDRRAIA